MRIDVIGNIIGSCPAYRGSSPLSAQKKKYENLQSAKKKDFFLPLIKIISDFAAQPTPSSRRGLDIIFI